MGVFQLYDGRLVAAPESSASEVNETVLAAVRAQSLELIDRPLFPVGWVGDDAESLLALDPTGQVVTIDVIPHLTAQTFVTALTRAGRHTDMNRGELAQLYPGGHDSFVADYENFVESSAPMTKRGPRLFIFAVDSDAGVQRPLAALRGVGVETYRIVIHEGADGPLVEIAENVEPRGVIDAAGARVGIGQTIDADEVEEPEVTETEPATEPEATEPEATETEPAEAALHEGESDAEEMADNALRYDEAWEISGWQFEKERPAKRDADEILGLVTKRRMSREERKAEQEEVLRRLAREREQVGTTLYNQTQEAAKRAEQRLWDMSAPKQTAEATIFSERFSSQASSDAVADAALRSDRWDEKSEQASHLRVARNLAEQAAPTPERPTPDPDMKRIVDEVGPVKITWSSRRRRSSISGHLTNDGLIDIIGVGIFADPTQAAAEASGNTFVDGWKIWQVPDGRTLGEFR